MATDVTELPAVDSFPASIARQTGVAYERFLDCVHCGLCTASCPTYLELGTEADSPRGRIYLMRAVADGRLEAGPEVTRHLELCLDCRNCETACPSGVQYGRIIEPFRVTLARQQPKPVPWLMRRVLFSLFPHARRLRWALGPARMLQKLGVDRLAERLGLFRLLPAQLRRMQALLPPLVPRGPELPELLPAMGTRRARVALFTGCVADAVFHHLHWATARVLQENGCDVIIPRMQTCCGAIHYHAGAEEPAVERALRNVRAFADNDLDAVVVNVAGCGAMLKDYRHLPVPAARRPQLEKFAAKVRDVCELLVELGPIPPTGEVRVTATYHDACHLAHAQQVRSQPRKLLEMIPGLELVPLVESDLCCGAAGTYNLAEPEMADRLGARKARHIAATDAQVVVLGNAGCHLHIGRALRDAGLGHLHLAHPIELLDRSYRKIGWRPETGRGDIRGTAFPGRLRSQI